MRVRGRVEGSLVLMNLDDKVFLQLEAKNAREVWKMLGKLTALAEEYEQADRIINDTAILLRAGSPFALSDRRAIVDAAKTKAAWDSDLRRYMPMKGITSQEAFGVPSIVQFPKKVVS